MQCRKISIMANLSDKYYIESNLFKSLSPSIRKRYFIRQNAFAVAKQISYSHIQSSSMPNEAFSQLISTKSLKSDSRGRRSQMIIKIGARNDFAIFTGKHLCWSLFLITLQAVTSATLLKKGSNTCFPVNIAYILRTAFLQNTSGGCF